MTLRERIRTGAGLSIVDVAELLLQECRANAAELHERYLEPAAVRAAAPSTLATADRAEAFAEILEDEERAFLADELERCEARTGSRAIAARAVAEGLDEARGAGFALMLQDRGPTYALAEGKAWPLPSPDLGGVLGGGLTPRLKKRGFVPDELPHLALAPPLRGFRVELVFDDVGALSRLEDRAKIGVALPNADPLAELELERLEHDGEPRFFHVRPRAPEAQLATVRRLAERAGELGVDVLLLPELCLEPAGAAAVQGALHPFVLVAGSCHELRGDERCNAATLSLAASVPLRHEKFNAFELDDDGVRRLEDLRPVRPSLRILWSGAWTLTLLICKDLLHPDVGPLLDHLRVSLVLVASWSPKGEFLRDLAGAATARSQAILVAANAVGPRGVEQPVAVASLPARAAPVLQALRGDVAPPCLLTLDLGNAEEWLIEG